MKTLKSNIVNFSNKNSADAFLALSENAQKELVIDLKIAIEKIFKEIENKIQESDYEVSTILNSKMDNKYFRITATIIYYPNLTFDLFFKRIQ